MAIRYEGYALLIGVNLYARYDRDKKLRRARKTLSGAVNDLRVWWDLARAAGIKPENIRVLSTESLTPAELETGAHGVTLGPASRAEILEGVEWFAQAVGGQSTGGFIAFCGHGDFVTAEGLALCPTDVRELDSDADPEDVVLFSELRDLLDQHAPDMGVTAFIDASFAGPVLTTVAGGAANGRSLTGRKLPEGLDATLLRAGDKVFTAVDPAEVAYELPTRYGWHGPLSLAVLELLDLYGADLRGGDGSVPEVVGERADGLEDLLRDLGLRPDVDTGGAPVNRDEVEDDDDGQELSGGINGFRSYDLMVNGAKVGQVNVDTTDTEHKETWYLSTLLSLDGSLDFTLTYDGKNPPSTFSGPGVISWQVEYKASNWVNAAGVVVPRYDGANNVYSWQRPGSPVVTGNKWLSLSFPENNNAGSLRWFAANSTLGGLLFTETSKIGDTITYNKLGVNKTMGAAAVQLIEAIPVPVT
ncbi:MAG: caspase family protein [Alphaproteobacteria bacterium]|nr:caspase family protein [Alphaproteobacteria bacterium]